MFGSRVSGIGLSLVELANTPGELAGYGPVVAEIARRGALTQVDGKWTYTVTDGDDVAASRQMAGPECGDLLEPRDASSSPDAQ